MSFYRETKRNARKQHHCFWCNKKIEKGEEYYDIAGVYDSDFFCQNVHLECHNQLEWALMAGDLISFEDAREYFDECNPEYFNEVKK